MELDYFSFISHWPSWLYEFCLKSTLNVVSRNYRLGIFIATISNAGFSNVLGITFHIRVLLAGENISDSLRHEQTADTCSFECSN